MFDVLLGLLKKEQGIPKDPIVDMIFGFVASDDQLKQCIEWMDQSEITVDGKSLYKLAKKHNYSILSRMFKSKSFSVEQKNAKLEKVIGDDKTDVAENTRAKCYAGLPDAEVKAKVWAEITDPHSKESVYLRTAKIQGFYSWDQVDILAPYFDQFYEVIAPLAKHASYRYFT